MKPHTFRFDYKNQLKKTLQIMVSNALAEDLNNHDLDKIHDITASLIPDAQHITAQLLCREQGVLCGKDWFNEVFAQLSTLIKIQWHYKDSDFISENSILCELTGPAQEILIGERTAMNFLQTLSGTATSTSHLVKQLEGTNCKLLDTRKTLPGFRLAQKYAVTCGGGLNHRIGLFDAYLIKENHIIACGGIREAVETARLNNPVYPIEVEVENLEQLQQALSENVDVIMLDNFTQEEKIEAVQLNNGQAALEASGDITLKTIKLVAESGVDYISVGAITKHLQALDLSLRVTN